MHGYKVFEQTERKFEENRSKFTDFEGFLSRLFVLPGHLKIALLTAEEALDLVFHDSGSEFDEENDESNDEMEMNSDNESTGEMQPTTGNIAYSGTNNHDPMNIH